jgi:lipopolysaccharide export system permease protein
LMQFLIKYLPEIVGKGLPFTVIVELILYNLAYMVVLAVPMSVLIAALFTFARLSETNTYLVIKSAGVSLAQLFWPALVFGLALTGGMWYFNSDILPEANFRAKNLWQDIQRKQPDFELQPGVFYNGLNGYNILVQKTSPGTGRLEDVLVYDYTEGSQQRAEIKAKHGRIVPLESGLLVDLILEDGEIHRLDPQHGPALQERYERLAFEQFRLRLDLSEFMFERTDPRQGYRSDRTMRTADMVQVVDSLEGEILAETQRIEQIGLSLLTKQKPTTLTDEPLPLPAPSQRSSAVPSARPVSMAGLDSLQQQETMKKAVEDVRLAHTSIEESSTTINWEASSADRYRVEIHKKRSIAIACVIFMLIGAPLGLTIRRGGMGKAGGLAVGIFMFYWVTLVQGEKLADRGMLAPWVGMWLANIVMVLLGAWLVVYITMDLAVTPPLRKRLWGWVKRGRKEPTRLRVYETTYVPAEVES